jgi:hypothetical protein
LAPEAFSLCHLCNQLRLLLLELYLPPLQLLLPKLLLLLILLLAWLK